jgi:DNA-binding NtrC family response regulator
MKILMIAGSGKHRAHLRELLEEKGYEIADASSCRSGFKMIESDFSIDMAIVDADIAEECGLKFLRRVRSSQQLSCVPVIMIGNSFDQSKVHYYLELGVGDIITLPVHEDTLSAKIKRAAADGKKTALVVDDDPAIVDVLTDFLHLERFHVLTAGSVEEGLGVLTMDRVHVVISDYLLPDKSGGDLLKEIKKHHPTLPVIMITGYSGRYTPDQALADGADAYFAKPFKNTELMYTLRRVLKTGHSASILAGHH